MALRADDCPAVAALARAGGGAWPLRVMWAASSTRERAKLPADGRGSWRSPLGMKMLRLPKAYLIAPCARVWDTGGCQLAAHAGRQSGWGRGGAEGCGRGMAGRRGGGGGAARGQPAAGPLGLRDCWRMKGLALTRMVGVSLSSGPSGAVKSRLRASPASQAAGGTPAHAGTGQSRPPC
jgi:hypothetical protein